MAGIELIEDQWPWVLSKFDGEQTPDELEAYIAAFDAIHDRQSPYATLSWMKKYTRNPRQVDRVGRWMRESEQYTRRFCIGTGIITQSLGFRFILSSIFLLKPMACPYQVCATFGEGEQFMRRTAQRSGIELPPVHNPWPSLPTS